MKHIVKRLLLLSAMLIPQTQLPAAGKKEFGGEGKKAHRPAKKSGDHVQMKLEKLAEDIRDAGSAAEIKSLINTYVAGVRKPLRLGDAITGSKGRIQAWKDVDAQIADKTEELAGNSEDVDTINMAYEDLQNSVIMPKTNKASMAHAHGFHKRRGDIRAKFSGEKPKPEPAPEDKTESQFIDHRTNALSDITDKMVELATAIAAANDAIGLAKDAKSAAAAKKDLGEQKEGSESGAYAKQKAAKEETANIQRLTWEKGKLTELKGKIDGFKQAALLAAKEALVIARQAKLTAEKEEKKPAGGDGGGAGAFPITAFNAQLVSDIKANIKSQADLTADMQSKLVALAGAVPAKEDATLAANIGAIVDYLKGLGMKAFKPPVKELNAAKTKASPSL